MEERKRKNNGGGQPMTPKSRSKGFLLLDDFLVEIVDLDILFQSLPEHARIIGGKEEEATSRGSIMVAQNVLKDPKTIGEESPFIGKVNMSVWGKPDQSWCKGR
jgi:hypothetical protein